MVIALVANFLGSKFPVAGGPVFGILLGIAIGSFYTNEKLQPGIQFTSKKVLQYAVILLGFGLNMQTVLTVGKVSLPIIVSTIGIALIVSHFLSKALDMDKNIATLVGVGSSICGGSAIAATAPVIRAKDEEVVTAISVIFLFNVIAALIFPTLGDMLGFSNEGFAIFAGTAVNDTSSVTATASSWDTMKGTGGMVLEQATIVKLTRTLGIIPITLGLSYNRAKETAEDAEFNVLEVIPRFILYFLLASILTTIIQVMSGGILSVNTANVILNVFSYFKKLSKFFIIMAMTAIGLNTNIVKLIKNGGKPIFLGFVCWIAIIFVSIGMQKVMGIF